MPKILSIIVPTYNMEALLHRCLDSLIIEHYLDKIEVIIVNDGSTDKSLEIAKEYSTKFPKTFFVIDKPNGNYGSCINSALNVASGKYVKVLDADDAFISSNFGKLIEVLFNIDVDLILNDYIKIYSDCKNIRYNLDLPSNQVINAQCVYNSQSLYNLQMPSITYKREIFEVINYKQLEGYSYTDMQWCFAPMSQVNTIYYINTCVYEYYLNRDGQTMDPKVSERMMSHRIECFKAMLDDIQQQEISKEAREYLKGQLVKHAEFIYRHYLIRNKENDRNLLKAMDAAFKIKFTEAYLKCNEINYRLHIPYKFIYDWRNGRDKIPMRYILLEKLLNTIGRLRIKLGLIEPDKEGF